MASNKLFERLESKNHGGGRAERLERVRAKRERTEALPDSNPFKASLLKRLERAERYLAEEPKPRLDKTERRTARAAARADGRSLVERLVNRPAGEKTTAKETPKAKARAAAEPKVKAPYTKPTLGQPQPALVPAAKGLSFVDRLMGKRPAAPVAESGAAQIIRAAEENERAERAEREAQSVSAADVGDVADVLGEEPVTEQADPRPEESATE